MISSIAVTSTCSSFSLKMKVISQCVGLYCYYPYIKILFTFVADGAPFWVVHKFLGKKRQSCQASCCSLKSIKKKHIFHYLSVHRRETGGKQAQEDDSLHH